MLFYNGSFLAIEEHASRLVILELVLEMDRDLKLRVKTHPLPLPGELYDVDRDPDSILRYLIKWREEIYLVFHELECGK